MAAREREAWTVRGGKDGEYEADSIEHYAALLGFQDIPDLSSKTSREAIKKSVRRARPRKNDRHHNNVRNQMYAFRVRMCPGDIVAMPLKSIPGFVAVGRILGDYERIKIDGKERHARPVEWREPHVDRSNIAPDLLASIDARQTISQPRAEDSNQRLVEIYESGIDPRPATDTEDTGDVASYSAPQDPENAILNHIRQRFRSHDFAKLVDAVLQAHGYRTRLSPPGPDRGVDIFAGRGPLGLEPSKLCVQVKATESPTGRPELDRLNGVIGPHSADQGLFVSWSGFTRDAEQEAKQKYFRIRLWSGRDLLYEIYRIYDRLPEEIRAEIPLQQVWTLVLDDDL